MKDAIRDYAINGMLLMLLIAMVGSCLMLIRTLSIVWFFITAAVTIVTMIANGLKYDDYDDLDDKNEWL